MRALLRSGASRIAIAAACAACASGGGSANGSGAFVTGRCPLPDDVRGYPLVVTAVDVTTDPAWLAEWARAAAVRWQVPSTRRGQFPAYRGVRTRIIPAVPRWADDWTPSPRHVAEMRVTMTRTGVAERPEIVAASEDDVFDRSLATLVRDPLPASPSLPPTPESGPDTVQLRVRFGHEPEPGVPSGVVRFARQQRPVRVMPGSLVIRARQNEFALVKYDVDPFGRFLLGSFEALDVSSNEIARAAQEGLERARFSPAMGDCEPIGLTVVQSFGRR